MKRQRKKTYSKSKASQSNKDKSSGDGQTPSKKLLIETVSLAASPSSSISPIFYFIPQPLWKQIIYYLRNDKPSLGVFRLVCRDFRKLTVPYWTQFIPDGVHVVNEYLSKISKFGFGIQLINIFKIDSNGEVSVLEFNILDKITFELMERLDSQLLIACEKGYLEIVKLLIKNEANINKSTTYGETPLFLACENGHLDVVKLLIEKDADINKSNKYGQTPLFITCQFGYKEIVQILLKNKADINQVSEDGNTALTSARKKEFKEIEELLINWEKMKK